LGGDADGLIHSNRGNAGSFLAQDVSDLHRNLLEMNRRVSGGRHCGIQYANCQFEFGTRIRTSSIAESDSDLDVLSASY
jgi:hypothetical protein